MLKELESIATQSNTSECLFQLKSALDIDTKKKTILFIVKEPLYEYSHLGAFYGDIMDVLEAQYNVLTISIGNHSANRHNYITFNAPRHGWLSENQFKRKVEDDENVEYNLNVLHDEFEKSFSSILKDIKVYKIIIAYHEWLLLPLTSYISEERFKNRKNQFHDYVGTDTEILKQTVKHSVNIAERFNDKVSILAFTMFRQNVVVNLAIWLYKNYGSECLYNITVDPAIFTEHFRQEGLNVKNLYYTTDKRGTRDFDYFPLAHFQHIFTEHKYLKFPDDTSKKYDFFLSGTLMYQMGPRSDIKFLMKWLQPLENLDPSKNSIWAPLKMNGLYLKDKQIGTVYDKKAQQKCLDEKPEFTKYLKEHPLYKGYFVIHELTKRIINYKYGLVLRCYSIEDSLNPRPVHYAHIGVLPFFDEQYDPEYLSIPKHIQDKLIVRSGNDVIEKIAYFNEHDAERLQLIEELRIQLKTEIFMETWKTDILTYFA